MKKIFALIIAAIMLVSFAGCRDNEGAPQKPVGQPTANIDDCAMLINNMTVSKEQFSYYYTSAYNYYAQMEMSYRQQGISIGFDTDKAPDEVISGQKDENGNDMTWNDVITQYAKTSAKNNFAFYAEATSNGYTLSSEEEAAIESTLETVDTNAANLGVSTNDYIDTYIAKGLDRDGVKKLLEIEAVAMAYEDVFREKVYSKITDEQIDERYNNDPVKYSYADAKCFRIAIPVTEQADGETDREFNERYSEAVTPVKEAASEIADSATSLSSFEAAVESYGEGEITDLEAVTYESVKMRISQDAADWMFNSERADGDVKTIETETAIIIIYLEKTAYEGISTDVRHCLVAFDSEEPTDEEKQETYEIASGLLADLEENGITEERFIDMVTENSDDAASVPDGGLYENITTGSNYVAKFKQWSLDPARKAGDCEIIETEYGYHVMYFVENNGADWRETVRADLGAEAYDNAANELLGENGKYQITVNDAIIGEATKEFCDGIRDKSINYAY